MIKIKFFIAVTLTLLFASAWAQDHKNSQLYFARVETSSQTRESRGILYRVTDEGLSLVDLNSLKTSEMLPTDVNDIHFTDIKMIRIRKENSVRKGARIGAIVGVVIGATIGFAQGDDPEGLFQFSAAEKGVYTGIALGAIGTALGAAVGAKTVNYKIHQNIRLFRSNKKSMRKYAYINP